MGPPNKYYVKIKFFSNIQVRARGDVNPAYFMLKTWYEMYGLNNDIVEWDYADLILFDTLDTIVERLERNKPDIIGLSVFSWNDSFQFELARRAKMILPDCIIVAGGPQLRAHRDVEFFKKHPYIDYVVYGEGEKAFQLLVDYHCGNTELKDEFTNIVEPTESGFTNVHPFSLIRDPDYLSTNVSLVQADFIREHVDYMLGHGIPNKNIIWSLTFAKGCMYKCSYCDWDSNLTKKVVRRKHDWKAEVDFFHDLNIAVRATDANFGQYDEDLEIYSYACSIYDPHRSFFFHSGNLPKLGKNTYELQYLSATTFGICMKFSFQDLNEEVLANVDRPSLTWDQQREMFLDRLRDDPDTKFDTIAQAELILGLPGQTFESFSETMFSLWSYGFRTLKMHDWQLLLNSPAYDDPEYGPKFGLEWIDSYSCVNNFAYGEIDDIYEELKNSARLDLEHAVTIKQTNTITYEEIMALRILKCMLIWDKNNWPDSVDEQRIVFEQFKIEAMEEAKRQYADIMPYYEKYGFIVSGSHDFERGIVSREWRQLSEIDILHEAEIALVR